MVPLIQLYDPVLSSRAKPRDLLFTAATADSSTTLRSGRNDGNLRMYCEQHSKEKSSIDGHLGALLAETARQY
jgi:hypothetical protein